MKLLILVFLSGCAIEANVVGASLSAHFLKDKETANTFNVQSGNQSSLEELETNPIYETLKFKQLKNEPERQ